MPYLIDGNNVMAQRVGWHRDKGKARRDLLDDLAHYAAARKVRVIAVFDGAPDAHFADGSSYRGVRLFYAEGFANADERIKSIVEESRERRTFIVVTSDRALADYVRRCGAKTVRAGEFRREIDAINRRTAGKREKAGSAHGPSSEEEMDEWMRYFGVSPEDDEIDAEGDG